MFPYKRHAVVAATAITALATGGGLFTAVKLAAQPAHSQPAIVQPAPTGAPAAPAFEDVAVHDG